MTPSPDDKQTGGAGIRTLGMGAFLTGLLIYLGNEVKDMITPHVVHIAVLLMLLAIAATLSGYAVSWTWTQVYKKAFVPDFRNLAPIFDEKMTEAEKETERRSAREEMDHWKGKIFLHAMASALLGECLAGVAIWNLLNLLGALPAGDWRVIFTIAWGIWGALTAYSSPYMWKWIFESLFPRVTGGFYSKVNADGEVGLKSADNPEDPTIYGRTLPPKNGGNGADPDRPGPVSREDIR